jgi:hypothetical protein
MDTALRYRPPLTPNSSFASAVQLSLASGAGRADLVVSGGSLPAGFIVHASECWDANFGRVFYTEDVDPTKMEGSPSGCALP